MAIGHPLGSQQLDRAFLDYFREQIGEEVRDWRGKGQGKVKRREGGGKGGKQGGAEGVGQKERFEKGYVIEAAAEG